jgi:hypothetical protein
MKLLKKIPAWATILILLLVATLDWMRWNSSKEWSFSNHSEFRAAGKQFKIEVLHTNGASGVGVFESKSERPIWVEWDFNNDAEAVQESYFFQGRDVFDVTLHSNRPPKYSVYFYGPGKSATWWIDDRGSGSFTDRIYYDTNGDFSRREVWYNQTWHAVNRQNGKNGVIIDGEWHQLSLDTNGIWTTEAGVSTNQ